MNKNRIFLSYRRNDSPGYVSRLEGELGREFGEGRVFRDATDIPGGTKWKNVIDANLHSSVVLILIIGPRWEQIWQERINDDVNYVALELKRARELDVPIIPVTLDGTQLSKDLDLGNISFIYENQFHDISDKQGRWQGDFQQLVRLLESVPGMGTARTSSPKSRQPNEAGSKSGFKWLAAVTSLLIVAAIGFRMSVIVDEPGANPEPDIPTEQKPVVQVNSGSTLTQTVNADSQPGAQQRPEAVEPTIPVAPLPSIGGTWQGRDGLVYFVQQYDDGSFTVESPGHGSGQGRFLTNMPRKFEIEMFGIGRGEFSVSFGDNKAMGWINVNGQQVYDTLIRIK